MQVLDLNTTSFEDIVGRLKAYEERRFEEEEEHEDDHGKLLYANNSESRQDGYGRGGRGRGGRGNWRGRGRGRNGGFYAQREAYKQSQNRDTSHITCFACDK